MGRLTEDATRLCGEIAALRTVRLGFVQGLRDTVAATQASFRAARAEMERERELSAGPSSTVSWVLPATSPGWSGGCARSSPPTWPAPAVPGPPSPVPGTRKDTPEPRGRQRGGPGGKAGRAGSQSPTACRSRARRPDRGQGSPTSPRAEARMPFCTRWLRPWAPPRTPVLGGLGPSRGRTDQVWWREGLP